jgi:hypothetical protein
MAISIHEYDLDREWLDTARELEWECVCGKKMRKVHIDALARTIEFLCPDCRAVHRHYMKRRT